MYQILGAAMATGTYMRMMRNTTTAHLEGNDPRTDRALALGWTLPVIAGIGSLIATYAARSSLSQLLGSFALTALANASVITYGAFLAQEVAEAAESKSSYQPTVSGYPL